MSAHVGRFAPVPGVGLHFAFARDDDSLHEFLVFSDNAFLVMWYNDHLHSGDPQVRIWLNLVEREKDMWFAEPPTSHDAPPTTHNTFALREKDFSPLKPPPTSHDARNTFTLREEDFPPLD